MARNSRKKPRARVLQRLAAWYRAGTTNTAPPRPPAARLLALALAGTLLLGVCEARLYRLALDTDAYAAVRRQSSWSAQLTAGRGVIYDHNLVPLTDTDWQAAALVRAGSADYTRLFDVTVAADQPLLYAGVETAAPFTVRLQRKTEMEDTLVFRYPIRYAALPLAQHIIGYLGADGHGMAGLERAFDDYLAGGGDVLTVLCDTDALARSAGAARVIRTQGSGHALQLTLDAVLQRICEDVAAQQMTRGAIVMLECATGRIKASVSMPQYDPQNVNKSILAGDTALINRAFSSYNVGSVYKPLLAALALENGISAAEVYLCTGSIEVDGHIYHCARRSGHGEVDMAGALEASCNCYFIQLGQRLGGEAIVDFSAQCGLGQATQLGGGYAAGSGNLPSAALLQNSGELAGLSFGQGQLTATPLQMAAAFNVFANGGIYVTPSLVEGLADGRSRTVTQSLYRPAETQVMSAANAAVLRSMLVQVVENGLGAGAAIPEAAVGGKTGTAQTGRTLTDETGAVQELYESWFVGFYPAGAPRYTVAIMVDAAGTMGEDVAPIFAALCRQLYYLEKG